MGYFQELKIEHQKFARELSGWHAGVFARLRAEDPTTNTQIREAIEKICTLDDPDQYAKSYVGDDVPGRVKAIVDELIGGDKSLNDSARTMLQGAADAIWARAQGVSGFPPR